MKIPIPQSLKRETLAYLVVGICTSAVSFGTYWLYSRVFGIGNEHVAKFLSMLTAMAFSFIPNKIWVFQSTAKRGRALLREVYTFFATRAFSAFVLEQGLFFVFIEIIRMHDLFANVLVMAIIVVVNYLFAKFYVFKKDPSQRTSTP